eukprot:3945256-Pyramimonas_sp.AAC.1
MAAAPKDAAPTPVLTSPKDATYVYFYYTNYMSYKLKESEGEGGLLPTSGLGAAADRGQLSEGCGRHLH